MTTDTKTIATNGAKAPVLAAKDFSSGIDVRWCPGCGDYSILAQVQRTLPDFGESKDHYVFVAGIGCSSRFPYYMNTYGMHSIHGRAPAIATPNSSARKPPPQPTSNTILPGRESSCSLRLKYPYLKGFMQYLRLRISNEASSDHQSWPWIW